MLKRFLIGSKLFRKMVRVRRSRISPNQFGWRSQLETLKLKNQLSVYPRCCYQLISIRSMWSFLHLLFHLKSKLSLSRTMYHWIYEVDPIQPPSMFVTANYFFAEKAVRVVRMFWAFSRALKRTDWNGANFRNEHQPSINLNGFYKFLLTESHLHQPGKHQQNLDSSDPTRI